MKYQNLFLVDVEARGKSPVRGTMTEFGVVHYNTRETFHGRLYEGHPDPENPAVPIVLEKLAEAWDVAQRLTLWISKLHKGRASLGSDNPAYDYMWMAGMYDEAEMDIPFGHSGRRISDFYAGVTGDWSNTQEWKQWRRTPHDHHPVHDAMGNAEALEKIFELAERKQHEVP